MVAQLIKNFNQENIIENKIDFYRLNNILIYLMIINKIISLIIRIFRREKKRKNSDNIYYNSKWNVSNNTFPKCKNGLLTVKKESMKILIIKETKRINENKKIIKDNQI